jgi:RimJ/RimL family protein N-acetyltransferase
MEAPETEETPTSLDGKHHLSTFRRSDMDEMILHLSNPAVIQNLRGLRVPFSKQEAQRCYAFYESEKIGHPQRARLRYTIRTETETPIGEVAVMFLDVEGWILGFWLAEKYWGKGIATWACAEALKAAKREGIDKITAAPKSENVASRKVLERNGFKYVRDGRQYFSTSGKVHDVAIFEISLE